MIAALYVAEGGTYYGLPDVDPWPASRDARLYAGPWPVVAHPPCERWSCFAHVVQAKHERFRIGDDGGCFVAALAAVRLHGGVLEHPARSMAWAAFGLLPPSVRGWSRNLYRPNEWTTEVAQRNYGHRAIKRTWLLYVGREPPPPRLADIPSWRTSYSCQHEPCRAQGYARALSRLASIDGSRRARLKWTAVHSWPGS